MRASMLGLLFVLGCATPIEIPAADAGIHNAPDKNGTNTKNGENSRNSTNATNATNNDANTNSAYPDAGPEDDALVSPPDSSAVDSAIDGPPDGSSDGSSDGSFDGSFDGLSDMPDTIMPDATPDIVDADPSLG